MLGSHLNYDGNIHIKNDFTSQHLRGLEFDGQILDLYFSGNMCSISER